MSQLKILGLSGSLRAESFNKRALLACQRVAGDAVSIEILTLEDIPLYNADLGEGIVAVDALRSRIEDCDAVLIATPEFNYGIPGVLKNALDWASRPAYASVFANKLVAILGASPGAVGTARAQGQLKQVLLGMLAEVFPYPELTLGGAGHFLEAGGVVTDLAVEERLRKFVASFATWVERHRRA